jgi:hypothetical protein
MHNRHGMGNLVSGCWGIVLACFLLCSHSVAANPTVSMVTDLQGQARLQWDQGNSQLTILTELAPGVLVNLEPNARLTLVYFKSGNEFTFRGPAQVYIREDQPVALEGQEPAKHALFGAGATDVAIKPLGLAQAGVVLRAVPPPDRLRLVAPVDTKTLEVQPVFRWQPVKMQASYHFELTDSAGRILFETDARGSSLRLPEKVQLQPGATYGWEIEGRLPDGHRYSSRAEFRVADAAETALVEKLRPTNGATLSQRVAFAALLEQMDLRDEARQYWRQLSKERPDDPTLRRLAAQ